MRARPEGLSGGSLKTQQYATDAVAPADPDPVDVLEAPADARPVGGLSFESSLERR